MIININEMLSAMKTLSLDPRIINQITGYKTSKIFDRIFARDIKAVNATEFLNQINTKEIELVTWTTEGGKFIPVGRDSFNAEKVSPYDLKLMTTYTPKDLYERLILRNQKYAAVYREMVETFLKHKKKVVINQCHEFFDAGSISYQVKDNDNHIVTKKTIDYTSLSGAIQTYSCDDLGSLLHDWSDPATTDENVLNDIVYLIDQMFDYTEGVYFNEGSNIEIWMGETAHANFVARKNPLNDVINRRGFVYSIGDMELPVIKETATWYNHEFNKVTGKYAVVANRSLAAKQIMIVNVVDGAYMIRDMKYMTVKNYDKDNATAFVLTGKELDHEAGVEFAFCSSPLVFGDTRAVVKATVVST